MTTHRRDAVTSSTEKTGDRTRRVVVSDESVDRYNTTFRADGWETGNFEKNPVLLWCHQAGEEPIGKALVSRGAGGKLLADCEFFTAELNPRADRVLRMLDAGVLAVSHRFEPLEYKYNLDRESSGDGWWPPIDYLRQELLEISIVTVPGNANALPLRELTDPEDLRLFAQAASVRSFEPPKMDVKKLRAAALRAVGDTCKCACDATCKGDECPACKGMTAGAACSCTCGDTCVEGCPCCSADRSARQTKPKPTEEIKPDKPLDEQELEVDGLDDAGVTTLVQETVKEVMDQRGRSFELRRRGELEVA